MLLNVHNMLEGLQECRNETIKFKLEEKTNARLLRAGLPTETERVHLAYV